MKQKKWWIIGGAAAIAVLAVVLIVVLGGKKEPGWSQIPEPGRNTLNVAQIPGFTPGANAPEATHGETEPQSTERGGTTEPAAPGSREEGTGNANESGNPAQSRDTEPEEDTGYRLSDPCLALTSLGGYSGNYLEDGSDELISNVAAILVTNNGNRMLQVAEVTFQVNDTEQAVFQITDLPVGATVLALEQNRREYSDEDDYSYGRVSSGYIDTPSLEEDKFALDTSEAGKLTLTNLTGESYGKVYVYYKYVQLGGVYLGGITYRVPFENVPPDGEAESLAGHFNPNNSRIMAVVVMPE